MMIPSGLLYSTDTKNMIFHFTKQLFVMPLHFDIARILFGFLTIALVASKFQSNKLFMPKGGLATIRQNEIGDLTTSLLTEEQYGMKCKLNQLCTPLLHGKSLHATLNIIRKMVLAWMSL